MVKKIRINDVKKVQRPPVSAAGYTSLSSIDQIKEIEKVQQISSKTKMDTLQ